MEFVEKIKKYDTLAAGLVVGVVLPIIGFVISYVVKTQGVEISMGEYFQKLIGDSPDKMDILIFSMIPNMFLFYFVNFRWQMYEFTKGIVGVTLVLGIIVVLTSL